VSAAAGKVRGAGRSFRSYAQAGSDPGAEGVI